ncbi:MAG: zinc ribbon domain-containing protein [Dehalogenimonas sp.]
MGKHIVYLKIALWIAMISLVITSAGMVAAADGEQITGYENVTIWVYPEYDDPRLLVMMEGDITGTAAPAEVRFLVPVNAQMYSAGSIDIQGVYSGGPPNREAAEIAGFDEISYEVTTNTFRVEYYAPLINGEVDKSISLSYEFLYPVSNLEVIIQEPRKSSEFIAVPAGTSFIDSEGFESHSYVYDELIAGQLLQYDITYTKSDSRPSLDINDTDNSNLFTVLLGALALIAGLAGFFFWLRSAGKKSVNRVAKRRVARQQPKRKVSPASGLSNKRFCSYCGKPLKGSGAFCAYCGEATG